jgi:hypothetical protein
LNNVSIPDLDVLFNFELIRKKISNVFPKWAHLRHDHRAVLREVEQGTAGHFGRGPGKRVVELVTWEGFAVLLSAAAL